jgi:hypothetical protein
LICHFEWGPFINADPIDVEDWATLIVTFSDGTKAAVFSDDMAVGASAT